MKKLLVCSLTLVLFFGMVGAASAALFTSKSNWATAAGGYSSWTSYGSERSTINSLMLDQLINFSTGVQVLNVGSSWATWSGGYTGDVLYTKGATSLTGTFSTGYYAFGFEVEPNPYAVYDITLTLADGSHITQSVDGRGGAAFFGWVSDEAILSFTISSNVDFAIGNFVTGRAAVPEPTSMLLLGFGLIGLGALKRKSRR